MEEGLLEIDINLIENAIRASVPDVGERCAVIYTLLGSRRRQGVEPFDYLKDLFTRLPAARIAKTREFTPDQRPCLKLHE